jgi:AhpC/TSA family
VLFAIWARAGAASESLGFDLSGRPVFRLTAPGTRVVVLVFAASDCPISNRYVPEIARLRQRFEGQGVRFFWVFPNPADSAAVVVAHNQSYAITEFSVLDVRHVLMRRSHVSVTPEAAVFLADKDSLREVYHGRIDDRYVAFGRERTEPRRHELEAAVAAALGGTSAVPPAGPAVGCAITPLKP